MGIAFPPAHASFIVGETTYIEGAYLESGSCAAMRASSGSRLLEHAAGSRVPTEDSSLEPNEIVGLKRECGRDRERSWCDSATPERFGDPVPDGRRPCPQARQAIESDRANRLSATLDREVTRVSRVFVREPDPQPRAVDCVWMGKRVFEVDPNRTVIRVPHERGFVPRLPWAQQKSWSAQIHGASISQGRNPAALTGLVYAARARVLSPIFLYPSSDRKAPVTGDGPARRTKKNRRHPP